MANKAAMKIEAGKYYQMRNGKKAWVLAIYPAELEWSWPVVGWIPRLGPRSWTLEGHIGESDGNEEYDLISEWSSEAVSDDNILSIPRQAYMGMKFRDGTSSTDYMYKDKILEPAKDELISPVTHSDIVEQINGKPQRYEPIESLDIRKILGKPLNTFENLTEDVLNLLIATVNQHSKQLGEM